MENQVPISDEDVRKKLQELNDPHCIDKGAKLQELCRILWAALEGGYKPEIREIDAFIALLMTDDNFLLAELVVPELRQTTHANIDNEFKRRIMSSTVLLREHSNKMRNVNWERLRQEQPLYSAEKDALHEAEMRRASILIFNNGTPDNDRRCAIRTWLEAYPHDSMTSSSLPYHPRHDCNDESVEIRK